MKIQAGECPDINGLLCPRWTEGGFPFFSNYVQPSCFARSFRQSFAFGFFWLSLRCSSHIYCSQHGVSSIQTSVLAFLFTRTRLVCSARPCCTPANLCDVIEAGALNASYRGQMWHLYVIDKLQLSCVSVMDLASVLHTKSKAVIRKLHFLLDNVKCFLQFLSIFFMAVKLVSLSQNSLTVVFKCHCNSCRL